VPGPFESRQVKSTSLSLSGNSDLKVNRPPIKILYYPNLCKKSIVLTAVRSWITPSCAMKFLSRFRTLWVAALVLLAISQVLHAYEDFERVTHAELHDHGHDSKNDDHSSNEAEHCHFGMEHSHGVAVITEVSFLRSVSCVSGLPAPTTVLPESPVAEIEYPPQLS